VFFLTRLSKSHCCSRSALRAFIQLMLPRSVLISLTRPDKSDHEMPLATPATFGYSPVVAEQAHRLR
jgi:hypothetical protein